MLVIKTDCCCSDSVKYSQKLKFLICCLSFLQDPAYDVIYRTHKPFWSHNCNNWLVHLLILRSKSLPLTFMVIFLSCLVFLQQPGGRHHPTKKKKKERAPAAGRCVGTSVYMQTSPFTQFNLTATPVVVSDGGGSHCSDGASACTQGYSTAIFLRLVVQRLSLLLPWVQWNSLRVDDPPDVCNLTRRGLWPGSQSDNGT